MAYSGDFGKFYIRPPSTEIPHIYALEGQYVICMIGFWLLLNVNVQKNIINVNY